MKLSIFSVQDHYPDRPRSLPQLYADVIAQARHAEALGYDTFWVAEHHFHEYGAVPNPAVFLSHLAAQTQRLRLGTAISILTFHHPIFSSGAGRENAPNRKALKPVIDKHKVDLLLQGHDHTYARGHTPIRVSESGSKVINSLYVNSVSGAKMYSFQKDGWKMYEREGVLLDRKAENTPFFQVIDVEGEILTYRAFMADGRLYDATRLKKNDDGTKELLKWDDEFGAERLFKNTGPHNLNGL